MVDDGLVRLKAREACFVWMKGCGFQDVEDE